MFAYAGLPNRSAAAHSRALRRCLERPPPRPLRQGRRPSKLGILSDDRETDENALIARTTGIIVCAAFLLCATRAARADESAAAQILFDEAKQLAGKGQYAQACSKFAESQRLDP